MGDRAAVQASLYEKAEQVYELIRGMLDLYAVDTGNPIPKLPPWSGLSGESRDEVYNFVGRMSAESVFVLGMLPEADLSDLPS